MLPVSRTEMTLHSAVRMEDLLARSFDVEAGIESGRQPDHAKGPGIIYSVVSIFCMLLLATMLGE